jgi:hypothetical protein
MGLVSGIDVYVGEEVGCTNKSCPDRSAKIHAIIQVWVTEGGGVFMACEHCWPDTFERVSKLARNNGLQQIACGNKRWRL